MFDCCNENPECQPRQKLETRPSNVHPDQRQSEPILWPNEQSNIPIPNQVIEQLAVIPNLDDSLNQNKSPIGRSIKKLEDEKNDDHEFESALQESYIENVEYNNGFAKEIENKKINSGSPKKGIKDSKKDLLDETQKNETNQISCKINDNEPSKVENKMDNYRRLAQERANKKRNEKKK